MTSCRAQLKTGVKLRLLELAGFRGHPEVDHAPLALDGGFPDRRETGTNVDLELCRCPFPVVRVHLAERPRGDRSLVDLQDAVDLLIVGR